MSEHVSHFLAEAIDAEQFRDAPESASADAPVSTWHRIFPDATLHHPMSDEPFTFGQSFREGMVATFEQTGLQVPLDFNHLSAGGFMSHPSKDEGSAPGWVTALEDRGSDGLWAHVQWNDDGLDAVRSNRYRYLSPEFTTSAFDKSTGKRNGQPRLFAVALTNRPFLENQDRLAASDSAGVAAPTSTDGATEGATMPENTQQLDELQAKLDAATAQLADLESKANRADEAAKEAAELRAKLCDEIIEQGAAEGRVTPDTRASVEQFSDAVGKDPDKVRAFVKSLPVAVRPERQSQSEPQSMSDDNGPEPGEQFTDEEKRLFKSMGIPLAEAAKFDAVHGVSPIGDQFYDANGAEITLEG